LAYYEVCEMLNNDAVYVWDEEMKVPYAVDGDQWVGFDDEKSIRNKMKWIKENGFGGAMVWTIDMDDFTGTVCGNNVKFPLIGAMREELRGISRGKEAKDVDWTSVASTFDDKPDKPEPIAIDVSELLQKAKKPGKANKVKSGSKKAELRSKFTKLVDGGQYCLIVFAIPFHSPSRTSVLLFDQLVCETSRCWKIRAKGCGRQTVHPSCVRLCHSERLQTERGQR
jgi:Glycosyl hydrolases family 18